MAVPFVYEERLAADGGPVVRTTARASTLRREVALLPFEPPPIEGRAADVPPAEAATEARPGLELRFDEGELARACALAFAQGVRIGRTEAEAEERARHARALAAIAEALRAAAAEHRRALAARAEQTGELALAIGRAVVPAALADRPLADLQELLRLCLERLQDEPRLKITVAGELVEPCREQVEALAAEAGFGGEVVVQGDERLALGDARVRWRAGEAVRDLASIGEDAEALVRRWLPEIEGW